MNRVNQQLTRSLLGAILSCGLTDPELRGLSRELRSGRLGFELADLLDALLERAPRNASSDPWRRSGLADVERAEAAIKRRRLSKAVLRELFESHAPASVQNKLHGDAAVAELLTVFFKSASHDDAQRFLTALETDKADDPFLKGIRDRSSA